MYKKSGLRILVVPNVAAPYDQRMVKGLAEGFNAIGHYAAAMSSPLPADEIINLCGSFSIDVVLQINRTRDPEAPFPSHIRHIAWFQDVFPETLDNFTDGFEATDILYALGDPKVLGLNVEPPCYVGSLFTGVGQSTLNFKCKTVSQDIDLSLCGGLPAPASIVPSLTTDMYWYLDSQIEKIPLAGRSTLGKTLRRILFKEKLPYGYVPYAGVSAMQEIAESFYRPLRGELDIHELAEAMLLYAGTFFKIDSGSNKDAKAGRPNKISRLIKPYMVERGGIARVARILSGNAKTQLDTAIAWHDAINYFSQSYPRILDRRMLVNLASRVSASLELYGPGLDAYSFVYPYFKGVLNTEEELLEIYGRSKINLSNNTHGLGMHSRTLECMAVGGFVFMHESPHDSKAGGMLTSFESGVHFGQYTPENFEEEARRWLDSDNQRIEAGMKAREVIREQHCWHHRAQQIIDDLSR